MLLAGCGTRGAAIEFIDTACHNFAPIFVSQDDVFTDGTARQILTHNESYVALCDRKRLRDGERGAIPKEP